MLQLNILVSIKIVLEVDLNAKYLITNFFWQWQSEI